MHSALLLAITALPFLGADALNLKCSTNARCGVQSGNKLTCKNSIFGNCCSKSGFCGSSSLHCGKGCQVGFGDCKSSVKSSSAVVPSSATVVKPSTSSEKVVVVSVTTAGASDILSTVIPTVISETSETDATPSSSAPVESETSYTPSSSAVATPESSTPSPTAPVTSETPAAPSSSAPVITDATTDVPSPSSSSAPAASSSSVPGVKVSTDGSCGGAQGFTCAGSQFGDCCSEYGWCGSTGIYCDAGCNSAFGNCNGASSSIPASTSSAEAPSTFSTATRTSSATPSPTQGVSTDAQCGAINGLTCLGSQFGDCCSQYNYCGSSTAFCGTGCQAGFGKCDSEPLPANKCNVEGFANEPYYASSFNLVTASDVSTCAALCLAEAECKSYLWNPSLGNCAYLRESLTEGQFAPASTNQFFWDRACAETA